MTRWIVAIMASALLIACGIVHGFWTDRWGSAAEPTAAAARLDDLPLVIGDWHGEVVSVRPNQAGEGVAGFIQRRYVRRQDGLTVAVALVCGRPGPVSIHTPDVCYGSSGYVVGARRRVAVAGGVPGEFWTADAVRTQATDEKRMRLYWGWYTGENWKASDDPRLHFARHPVVHKLYVLRELGSLSEPAQGDPCEAFLQVLLPEMQRTLFRPGL
jgi:uncharacterized protein DUF3485